MRHERGLLEKLKVHCAVQTANSLSFDQCARGSNSRLGATTFMARKLEDMQRGCLRKYAAIEAALVLDFLRFRFQALVGHLKLTETLHEHKIVRYMYTMHNLPCILHYVSLREHVRRCEAYM